MVGQWQGRKEQERQQGVFIELVDSFSRDITYCKMININELGIQGEEKGVW